MRIALVIYGDLNTRSGGFLYDRLLVEQLRASGDTVEVISMPWRSYPGCLLHNLDRRWFDRLARLQVDVLLQDELNHPSLFSINRRLKRSRQIPLVAVVHHLRVSEPHPAHLRRLYRSIERAYLRTLDGCIYNSASTQASVAELAGSALPGVVATPGGDRLGSLSADQIRVRCNHAGPLRLLFLGNLLARKGLHDLISALAMLTDEDWTLTIAGRADFEPTYAQRQMLEVNSRKLSGRVAFRGDVDDDALPALLSQTDLLVVPSHYEGFGIVYLEAMSHGIASIAGSAGGAAGIIQPEVNGWLVKPGDAVAIQSIIRRLCRDHAELRRASLAARERFDAFPGWSASLSGIRTYLQTLVN